jgi:hypothetical protein
VILVSKEIIIAAEKYSKAGLSEEKIREKLISEGYNESEVNGMYILMTHDKDEDGNFVVKDKNGKVISIVDF